MLEIDGSIGEGGGQVLRSALSLSLLTGTPFHMKKIRAGRSKPGLLRQHLTALEAATKIGGADVIGAAVNSTELTFVPGKITAGDYVFKVGTAGSATLVMQTILMPLLRADGPSKIRVEGGTHNPWAPPFDFIEQAFLPLLHKMGADVRATLVRPGFYPAGGGCIDIAITPGATLKPLDLTQRGRILCKRGVARVAGLAGAIAKREIERLREKLSWDDGNLRIEPLSEKFGPGNVVVVSVESEHVTEVFTGFGERGVSAEEIADRVAENARAYIASEAPVGSYLADQLLIPIAMVGRGRFTTMPLSRHTLTNIDVIRQFLPVTIETSQIGEHLFSVAFH
jgi:RNA 3'-terminal phosphate cyclase (ATP)